MSIAEFYVETGLHPNDHEGFDRFMESFEDPEEGAGPRRRSGRKRSGRQRRKGQGQRPNTSQRQAPTPPSQPGPSRTAPEVPIKQEVIKVEDSDDDGMVLSERDLDAIANTAKWQKIVSKVSGNSSYARASQRLIFDLRAGTVALCRDHPTRGMTNATVHPCNIGDAVSVFNDPDSLLPEQTSKRRRLNTYPPPCRFGAACTNIICTFDHSAVMCRYGDACLRPGCWYQH